MSELRNILVLDSASAFRSVLGSAAPANWSVEHATGQADALARLRRTAYNLVLTGLETSGEEDVKFLRQLRRVRPHVKLIVLTADSTPAAVLESIRGHAFSYFSGPFSADAVRDMIQRALDEPAWDDGIEVLSASPDWVSLRLKCRNLTAERLLQFMKELEADLPLKEREDIGAAFREMLLNAIEHGGKFDPEQNVDICYIRTKRMILYQVRDPGEGFSMDSLPQAAISNPEDSPVKHALYRAEHGIRPGGFGILLTRGLVDEMIYNQKGNEVVLIKYLDQNG